MFYIVLLASSEDMTISLSCCICFNNNIDKDSYECMNGCSECLVCSECARELEENKCPICRKHKLCYISAFRVRLIHQHQLQCGHCKQEIDYTNYDSHIENCDKELLQCQYDAQVSFLREDLIEHCNTGQCLECKAYYLHDLNAAIAIGFNHDEHIDKRIKYLKVAVDRCKSKEIMVHIELFRLQHITYYDYNTINYDNLDEFILDWQLHRDTIARFNYRASDFDTKYVFVAMIFKKHDKKSLIHNIKTTRNCQICFDILILYRVLQQLDIVFDMDFCIEICERIIFLYDYCFSNILKEYIPVCKWSELQSQYDLILKYTYQTLSDVYISNNDTVHTVRVLSNAKMLYNIQLDSRYEKRLHDLENLSESKRRRNELIESYSRKRAKHIDSET